jgi:hypothetical protein
VLNPEAALYVFGWETQVFPEDEAKPPRTGSRRFSGKKRIEMKVSKMTKSVLLGLALLLATGAFAANKGSLQLSNAANISGKQLAAGDYTVKWDGNGPNVQASIMKGKNVVATVPARLVDLDRAPGSDAAVITNNADGSRSLTQIRFSGKKAALAIGEEASKAESSEASK